MLMPAPDTAVLARRGEIIASLRALLPPDCLVVDETALKAYECDALSVYRQVPIAVALPRDTAEVSAVLACCHKEGVKVGPRGAGTSLSGGALPLADSVGLVLGKAH